MGRSVSVLVGVMLSAGTAYGTTVYVDDDNCPGGTGSEVDPFCTIQAGINAVANGDDVLVADGTYNELINFHGRAITVHSMNGAVVTTIDGTGLNESVVRCANGEGPDTVLNGFTITNGDGVAAVGGGGMFNFLSSPTVTNCTFSGNSAVQGGGMFNVSSSPTVTNCTFSGNVSNNVGGGMYNFTSSPTVTNCTFSGNEADLGGGMYNLEGSNPTVTNCILWGDSPDEIANQNASPTVSFSDVEGDLGTGTIDGGGNIDEDPMFVDADSSDFRLTADSPCINAGDPNYVPDPGETDLDGHARVLCDRVDMGAYEFGVGDYDCNRVVDLFDFEQWLTCYTGVDRGPIGPGCEAFDADADGDVDWFDFATFQLVFTGVP